MSAHELLQRVKELEEALTWYKDYVAALNRLQETSKLSLNPLYPQPPHLMDWFFVHSFDGCDSYVYRDPITLKYEWIAYVYKENPPITGALMDEAATTIETQAAEIARLRASLEEALDLLMPFADAASDLDDSHPDHIDIWEAPAAGGIDAGDLRAARDFVNRVGETV